MTVMAVVIAVRLISPVQLEKMVQALEGVKGTGYRVEPPAKFYRL